MKRADRNGPGINREYVRARPFRDWLNDRYDFHCRGAVVDGRVVDARGAMTPLERLLSEIGWPATEAGARRVFRYRRGIVEGSVDSVKGPRPTEWFPRELVEDALHFAGVDFYGMYPEFASERDIELEPAAWCPNCQEHVTPIEGECPWDGWKISEGHMNLQAAA